MKQIKQFWGIERIFELEMDEKRKNKLYKGWKETI